MGGGSATMGMPGVGAPPQAGLDPQSAAGPGMGGAATAEGIAASTTPEEQPQQPAPPDPMAGQQQAPGWLPGVDGQLVYQDGMGPVTGQAPEMDGTIPIAGQAPKIAAHSGLLKADLDSGPRNPSGRPDAAPDDAGRLAGVETANDSVVMA